LIKNFLLALFISRGVPMLLGGDEFRRTQKGNNNAYCQDNAVSWMDWAFLEKHNKVWRLAVDTSRLAPDDVYEPGKEPSMQDQISFRVEPRSSAILLARG
jgi:hypothetical protein